MKKYGIVDSSNNYVRTFLSYDEAKYFRDMNSRLDWIIIPFHNSDYKSTIRQQASVRWVENTLNKRFTGNIKSGLECSEFLSSYLDEAKQLAYNV